MKVNILFLGLILFVNPLWASTLSAESNTGNNTESLDALKEYLLEFNYLNGAKLIFYIDQKWEIGQLLAGSCRILAGNSGFLVNGIQE